MMMVPDPLHPAVVHFPVAMILLGTVTGVAAVFVRRWHLPFFAAGLLVLGAAGAFVATWSGDEAEDSAGQMSHGAKEILEEHEEWGEATRNAATLAAILAITSVAIIRLSMPARVLSLLAALAAIWASYCVAETGHYGGELVYGHGVGIRAAVGIGEFLRPSEVESHEDDHD